MNINVFSNYEIEYNVDYSYLNEYKEFSNGTIKDIKKISGDKLIDMIKNLLSSSEIINVNINENEIYIETYNHYGECSDIILKIKRVEK